MMEVSIERGREDDTSSSSKEARARKKRRTNLPALDVVNLYQVHVLGFDPLDSSSKLGLLLLLPSSSSVLLVERPLESFSFSFESNGVVLFGLSDLEERSLPGRAGE